ncbi:hypothetical protein [Arenibacter algicola]|uniref:hypothetical protein n=1 Tax=Arenibacter algicola TaxID=616991 RepID=UPI0004DF1915|nr:hypothetical protein [Arenibacter algicola]|tara:strand:- start:14731 stop:15147 length:417 start_codon:yes stop_codon:yes gene_type:complete
MGLIEKISNVKAGFHPVLIKDSWQVCIANYSQYNEVDRLDSLIINDNNSLALSLLTGRAVLIIQKPCESEPSLEAIAMVRGTSYVIPENVGYNLIMEKGCQVIGVERPNTHSEGGRRIPLTTGEIERLKKNINKEFKS